MEFSSEMLEYTPYLPKGSVNYIRKEKNSTYTIKLAINNFEQSVNESFINFIQLFDGKNSVKDILGILQDTYSEVPINTFKSDILDVILKLSDLQILRGNTVNPFLPKLKVQLSKDKELYLADYTCFSDIKRFLEFTKTEENKPNYIEYYNPLKFSEKYNELNLIIDALRKKEYIFILQENNQVEAILNFKEHRENLVVLDYMKIKSQLENKEEIISFALTTMLKITQKDLKIFRANLINEDNKNLAVLLKNIGFEKTVLLKDELGVSIDIEEYNYYV